MSNIDALTVLFNADRAVQAAAAKSTFDQQEKLLDDAVAAGAAPAFVTAATDPAERAVLVADRAVHSVALVLGEIARRAPEHFIEASSMVYGQFRELFESLEDVVRRSAGAAGGGSNAEVAEAMNSSAAAAEWARRAEIYAEQHVLQQVAIATGEERDGGYEAARAVSGL